MYQIDDLNLVKEMEKSYLEYSLSVIIGRAIPDVRDGLKPVHRRILYAMDNIGCLWNKSYKKSARIVGDVIGKYHPHGDSAVYDALVRMSQSFNMYTPLVDGQGNFGSIDGDNAAAMRYTEARMSKISSYLLADIDKNTVDFRGNYDNALSEPVVLPSRVPNILLNGASGIAVGMATNIPPHNLGEILDGLIYLIDNPECSIDELIEHIPAPDFPTGGDIVGGEIKSAYRTGKGNVVIRGKTEKEEISAQRERLVIKEIPFNLNKEKLVTKIAELVENNKIEGISDLRDESDRTGIRIAIDLKKNVNSDVICNKLYKLTQLENTFSINMLVVNQGQPQLMNLKDILSTFYDFRKEIVVRRTKFELDKAEKRLHILDGLLKALDNIDEIVKLIKQAQDTPTAKENLIQQFGFSEVQSKSILEMRLQNLTNLEKDKIVNEHEMLQKNVRWFLKILNDEEVLNQVIKEELEEVRDNFSCDRRSNIEKNVNVDITDKEMYPDDEMIITYTRNGYIKRVPASEYRTQIKGGKGSSNINKNVDDTITHVLPTTNHKFVFIFTNMGRMFKKYVFELPCKGKNNKGVHIANIIKLKENEKVAAFTIMEEESLKSEDNYLFFVTEKGRVKKLCFSEFANMRNSGKNATKIKEGDRLLNVNKVTNDDEVMLVGTNGKGIRFKVDTILPKGNLAIGVHGMRFKNPQDRIISSSVITADKDRLFMVAQNGFGKKSWMTEYKIQARGGQGTTIMKLDEKTGDILNAFPVNEEEEIIVSTKAGKIIKFQAKEIRETARMTKGIRIIRLENGDEVYTADTVSFDT